MGEWFKKPRPPVVTHTCEQPSFALRDQDIVAGDRFQCSCGRIFEVTKVTDAYA